MTAFDWGQLAFSSKKPVNSLDGIFIAAPRELSQQRFIQLIKRYLPKGNIILGISKEDHVSGFEGQPQFKMLRLDQVQAVIDKVNNSSLPHRIAVLFYHQREIKYLLQDLEFKRTIFINGSWKYAFHTQEPFYVLINKKTPYELVSPFVDEDEARKYASIAAREMYDPNIDQIGNRFSETDLMELAGEVAKQSFDYSFQTGVILGRKVSSMYEYLVGSYNAVVPYQTYAMHHGASRERNFSPPHDLNHYDAVHAEMDLIVRAGNDHIDLKGTSLFINLLPCPTCARILTRTGIEEFIYAHDHSQSYAIAMLEAAGKKVRRLTVNQGV